MRALALLFCLALMPWRGVAAPPGASMVLRLEVEGPPPPARGRYVIQRRACHGEGRAGLPRTVPVALDSEHAPDRAVRIAPGCYDVRFESLDRRGAPVRACELGAAAGVAVRGDGPTTVVFVGHCEAAEPPLVN